MSVFEHAYPYTDFHELNLDFLLGEVKKLNSKVDDFYGQVAIEVVRKYIDKLLPSVLYDAANERMTVTTQVIPMTGVEHIYTSATESIEIPE